MCEVERIPGIGVASDDRRNNMLSSEFGDGRDLLHHVVTEEYDVRHVRHKGASVTGVDGDRSRRVDEVSGNLSVVARWFLQIYGRNNLVMQGVRTA